MTDTVVEDLFFEGLLRSYIEENRRFLRRDWLAAQVDEKLREPGSRFLLLTAKPGLGKTAFMAQLARDHPEWLRYFIRRDQRTVLSSVSDKSLLLRIGYQLAARQPQLFGEEQLRLSVSQHVDKSEEGVRVVAATIERLTVSPFYKSVVEIEQRVRESGGDVIGLEVQELVADVRLLSTEDLLYLALIQPALALQRLDPTQQIVILIDALDEIEAHRTPDNILAWLANLQDDLPANIRFVLTSRDVEGPLNTFRTNQASRGIPVTIDEADSRVKADVAMYVGKLVIEPVLAPLLDAAEGGVAAFTTRVVDKTQGNLGYLDALARSIDHAREEASSPDEPTAARGRQTLAALVNVSELPSDLQGLYAFFLGRIKDDVARERVEVTDPSTGETYDKPVWPTIYARLLGVLAVAMEALDFDLLLQLIEVRAERTWIDTALGRLRPFLDTTAGHYRFYHATVAEFLTADNGSDLHVDAGQWHRRIADRYWRSRDDWSPVDGYGLAHLAAHLREADDTERLYALLTPAWSQVKRDRFGSASSFSADIHLALDCASSKGDLPAMFKIGLLFGDIAIDVPVAALETLALLGDDQGTADYLALIPSASDRLAALKGVLPLMRQRSGLDEVRRLFRDQVLSLSGGSRNCTPEEIFALVGVGEIDRAHARAQAVTGDAGQRATAWLNVVQAEKACGLDPRIPDNEESELESRLAILKPEYRKAGALATIVELMLETGNLDKASAWAEKALTVALDASWSDEAARVLSVVVRLLEQTPEQAATGELALRLARNLGTNGARIWHQKEIVPWLLRSGRDGDAFDLAEHVHDPRNWRKDLLILGDDAEFARDYTGQVMSAIASTLFTDLKDAPQVIARMMGQLAGRPVLREWADESRILAMLGIGVSHVEDSPKGAAELLHELNAMFPEGTRKRGRNEDEDVIKKFLAAAMSLLRANREEEATEVTLEVLAKIRELGLRSEATAYIYCYPEEVAIELIARHETSRALQIANAIATCPTLDPGWRVGMIARDLASRENFKEARELIDDLLSTVRSEDVETIGRRRRLVERLMESFSSLGALERCIQVAAALPSDDGRFAFMMVSAETFVARNRVDAARKIMDFAMETLREFNWRNRMDEESASGWLEALERARLVLIGLGADTQALPVVDWMDECLGWLSDEGYRTWAQIKVAKALVWAGKTERAVWLSTQTDWDDLESKNLILQAVAVALALGGKEEESDKVLRSIKDEAEQAKARLLGAVDLVGARYRVETAIAWARQGFRGAADSKALLQLVTELAEHGQLSQANDVSTWIADPEFQADAWISISEALRQQGRGPEAVPYARQALEAVATIAVRQRVDLLKRIVNVCISLTTVPQSNALLRRAMRIGEANEDADWKADLLAQIASARLLNELPSLPDLETLSPYMSLEWTCAFAQEIDYVVVPVQEKPSIANGVACWLTVYAGYFESESSFVDLATNGLDIVLNTLKGLDDALLEKYVGSARSLAGTAAIPNIEATAEQFVQIAAGIESRSGRANALTLLISVFAESGFAAHSLDVAARALPLIVEVESSSSFVSHAVKAANSLLSSGHSSEAVTLLAFALEAAKWDKKALFEAASSICPALVQLNREEDLWSLFVAVEPPAQRPGILRS